MWNAVWRIRDVYPGSRIRLFSIPDPNCLHPGSELSPSRILKEFKYFNPKKADPDADFLPSRIQGSKRHPIPDPGSGSATLVKYVRNSSMDIHYMQTQCLVQEIDPVASSQYLVQEKGKTGGLFTLWSALLLSCRTSRAKPTGLNINKGRLCSLQNEREHYQYYTSTCRHIWSLNVH